MENNKGNNTCPSNKSNVDHHSRRDERFVGSSSSEEEDEEDHQQDFIHRLEKLYQDLTSTSAVSSLVGGQDDESQQRPLLSLSLSFEQIRWTQKFRDVVEKIFDLLPQQQEEEQQDRTCTIIPLQFHEIRIDGSITNSSHTTERQHDFYPRRFPPFSKRISLYRVVLPPYHRLTFPSHLQRLELNGLVIDTTITSSLPTPMKIYELDLTDSRIVDIENLAEWLSRNKSLTKLCFDECNLMDEPLSRLIRSLTNHPTLQCLVIDNNKCRSRSVGAIAGVLRSPSCVLQHLSMANVAFGSMQEINIRPILEELREHRHHHRRRQSHRRLRILDIGMNNLDDTIMEDIVEMLRSPNLSSLEVLKLYGNKFTNNSIRMFANHLHEYKSLRCLDIEGLSLIDDEETAVKILLDGLKDGKNQTLVDIAHDMTSASQPLSHRGRRSNTVEVLNYHLDINWGRCRQVLNHDDTEKKDKKISTDAVDTTTNHTATVDVETTTNNSDKTKQKPEQEFPLSLWPHILYRANKGPTVAVEDDEDSSVASLGSIGQRTTTKTTMTRRPVASDIIKYFVQNGSSSFITDPEKQTIDSNARKT